MGYREPKKGKYCKPVGFNLFVYEVEEKRWTNWFIGTNEAKLIWNSSIYEKDTEVKDDFLRFLKYSEAMTRLLHLSESQFEFLTIAEKIDL